MTSSVPFSVAVVIVAGVSVALQGLVNAGLGRAIGSATGATTVSYAVGLLAMTILLLASGEGAALRRLPEVSPVLLAGGLLGAVFVWSMTWGVPRLGVLTAFAALILGQMTAALALDALGAFGMTAYDISWKRILAAVLVAAGVVLSRL